MVAESIVKPSKTHPMKEPEEGFDMTILPSRETGLPFVVFILQDIGIIPEVRIEIARSHRVWRSKTVKVAIRPTVRLRDGYLDAHELALLTRWVDLNRDALCRLSELLTIRATECGKMCHERWRDPTVSSYCACITHFGSSLGRRADGVGLAV